MPALERQIRLEELTVSFNRPVSCLRLLVEAESGLFGSTVLYESAWLPVNGDKKRLVLQHTLAFTQRHREEFVKVAVEFLLPGGRDCRDFAFYGFYDDLARRRRLRLRFAHGGKLQLLYRADGQSEDGGAVERAAEKLPRSPDLVRLIRVALDCVLKVTLVRRLWAQLRELWLRRDALADLLRAMAVLAAIAHAKTILLYFLAAMLFTPLRYEFRGAVRSLLGRCTEARESIVEEESANISFLTEAIELATRALEVARAAATSGNRLYLFYFFKVAVLPLAAGALLLAAAPLRLSLSAAVLALWAAKYRLLLAEHVVWLRAGPAGEGGEGRWAAAGLRALRRLGLGAETPRVLYFDEKRQWVRGSSLRQRLFPSQRRAAEGGSGDSSALTASLSVSRRSEKAGRRLRGYVQKLALYVRFWDRGESPPRARPRRSYTASPSASETALFAGLRGELGAAEG